MNILLTNDDGVYAEGIRALYKMFSERYSVTVVAPDRERSAVGHAITLSSPLRVQTVNKNGSFYGYAVTGTPADCVKIAVQELLERPPDMILSGINLGANVGINILYSGTVSAAVFPGSRPGNGLHFFTDIGLTNPAYQLPGRIYSRGKYFSNRIFAATLRRTGGSNKPSLHDNCRIADLRNCRLGHSAG